MYRRGGKRKSTYISIWYNKRGIGEYKKARIFIPPPPFIQPYTTLIAYTLIYIHTYAPFHSHCNISGEIVYIVYEMVVGIKIQFFFLFNVHLYLAHTTSQFFENDMLCHVKNICVYGRQKRRDIFLQYHKFFFIFGKIPILVVVWRVCATSYIIILNSFSCRFVRSFFFFV